MALYSDIIDTNSKWMWSSITTGTIGILFLAGAFWGLSTSMNNTNALFISQPSSAFSHSIIPKKTIASTPLKLVVPNTAKTQTQKVNRAAKQDSTYIKSILKPAQVKSTNKRQVAIKADSLPVKAANAPTIVASRTPTIVSTTRQASNLSQKTLSKTQLASIQVQNPQVKIAPAIANSSISAEKANTTPKEFKQVDLAVKVKKGDTLLKILKQNGASSSEAAAIINKLRPHVKVNALEIGQPLTITLDRRTNNSNIHPIKLIIPLGYRANKPDAILKDRVSISYASNNSLVLDLPTNKLSTITMRPNKPLRAPKFTPAPPKAINNKSTAKLSQKIASIASISKSKKSSATSGTSRRAYYRTRSWVKGSFKKTIAAQRVPKDVQSRLLSVYNQTASSKKVRNGDILEVFFDQTESATGKFQKLGKLLYVSFKANGKNYTYYRFGGQFYDVSGKSINVTTGSSGGSGIMSIPVPGARMTSKFGMRRHPVFKRWKMHSGTDFAAPRGTPIYAAASGKVTVARWYGGAGRYVQIDHQNGYNSGYMHMTRFAKGMKKGRTVKRGQIIGYVGSTGTATGNHLHFEVRKNGKKINPMSVVGRGSVRVASSGKLSGSQLKKFRKEKDRIINALNRTQAFEKIAKK